MYYLKLFFQRKKRKVFPTPAPAGPAAPVLLNKPEPLPTARVTTAAARHLARRGLHTWVIALCEHIFNMQGGTMGSPAASLHQQFATGNFG